MRFHRDEIKDYDDYFDRIGKKKKLTAEEERMLFRRYKAGDEAALDLIMRHNMRFVTKVAIEYMGFGVSLEDLLAEGNAGLLVAAMRFDQERGVKFITYAVYWIRDYIKSFVSKSLKSTEYGYDDVMNGTDDDDDHEFSQQVCDERYDAYTTEDSMVTNISISQYVCDMLTVLSEREKNVVRMYFGLGNTDRCDLKEISEIIKISKERVRQIIESSIRKMRIAAINKDSFHEDSRLV